MFIEMPMFYSPGDRFHYNNGGYVLLAIIMENITGLLFAGCLAQEVFTPCGMTDTSY